MINWGVVGAGRIAHRFCKALSYDSRAKLEAVSCRSLAKANAFKELHPCNKAYDSFQAVIDDENIDAVYISLPHYYHYEWAKKALLAGKHVLVEKPATMNVEQLLDLQAIAKEKQLSFMEAKKERFVPAYLAAKKMLNDGIIGQIEKIDTSFCGNVPYKSDSYLFDPKQGGCLLDIGVYNISYVEDLLDQGLSDVKVECNYHDCGVEIYLKATLQFGSQTGIIECAMDRKTCNHATLYGTKGKMIITPLHRPNKIRVELNDGSVSEQEFAYENDDMYSEVAHFNTMIIDGLVESPIMSFYHSLQSAKVTKAIREKI